MFSLAFSHPIDPVSKLSPFKKVPKSLPIERERKERTSGGDHYPGCQFYNTAQLPREREREREREKEREPIREKIAE